MVSNGFNPPKALNFNGNIAENWRRFEQDFDIFVSAAHSKTEKKTQSYILLNLAGSEAIERAKSFNYNEGESKEDPDVLKQKFRNLCNPCTNTTMERHKFRLRKQQPGEPFQAFLTDLRNLSSTCNFREHKDDHTKDQIVFGIYNDSIRKILLREPKLSLPRAIELCTINELADQRVKELNQSSAAAGPNVDYVKTQGHNKHDRKVHRPHVPDSKRQNCGNCGKIHEARNCPAYGKRCKTCKKLGHFWRYCRSPKAKSNVQSHGPRADELHIDNEQFEHFVLESVTIDNVETGQNECFANMSVHSNDIKLKIDTGAKCNVLPVTLYDQIHNGEQLNNANPVKLISYSGDTIETLGQVNLPCMYKDVAYDVNFHVVNKSTCQPLLGLADCTRLGLVSIHAIDESIATGVTVTPEFILNRFADLFKTDLGKLPVTYKMKVNPEVTPVICPPRRLPVAMYTRVKQELNRMIDMKVIAPVDKPTPWVSSMVAVEKKDKSLRICIDPRKLNEAILRHHYPMRTIEEVASHIPGAKYFTVLDASSGFWQVELEEESSYLTTFITPFGRFRFRRLPFGIKSAPEIFQQAMDQMFSGYPCEVIVDDILICGRTEEEHDANLLKVLKRAQQVNLGLKLNKCHFKVKEIGYVGHILTDKGLKPDPEKVAAIREMPTPDGVKALQRFLGMVTYLAKFIPQLSTMASPLRELLHHDSIWSWESHHDEAYRKLKDAIASPTVLPYYDPHKPVTLTCDASQGGLGAACMQPDGPIAYASRALTSSQRNYAQIEKELLGIVFACTKFDHYIYGRTVNVETDHKPLETLFKRPLLSVPTRLQRMMMSLQRYDLRVSYKRGSTLFLADSLSRGYATAEQTTQNRNELSDVSEYNIVTVDSLPITTPRRTELVNVTAADATLQKLMTFVNNGWPTHLSDVPLELKSLYSFRDQIVTHNGILFKGEKIIVPLQLQPEYLRQLHQGHIGAEATKTRARDIFYWPLMNDHIDNMIQRCSICNSTKPHQKKEPLKLHDIPEPWSIVASDLFYWNGNSYLVLVDSYTFWFEINSLTDQTASTVIRKLKSHFARYGVPDKLLTDNGPQYANTEFRTFENTWGFQHVRSSPQYPQSNGLAERAVGAAKSLLEKCRRDGSDPYLAILNMRNVPRDNLLGSPAQRFLSRRTQTTLPIANNLLQPKVIPTTVVQNRLEHKRLQQKSYYDRTANMLPSLNSGDIVRLQTTKGYDKLGIVKAPTLEPRSYVVESDGTNYRRNRRHLLKTKETYTSTDNHTGDNISSTPPDTLPSTPDTHHEETTHMSPAKQTTPEPIITRCGRVVKPNPRYTDYVTE